MVGGRESTQMQSYASISITGFKIYKIEERWNYHENIKLEANMRPNVYQANFYTVEMHPAELTEKGNSVVANIK